MYPLKAFIPSKGQNEPSWTTLGPLEYKTFGLKWLADNLPGKTLLDFAKEMFSQNLEASGIEITRADVEACFRHQIWLKAGRHQRAGGTTIRKGYMSVIKRFLLRAQEERQMREQRASDPQIQEHLSHVSRLVLMITSKAHV